MSTSSSKPRCIQFSLEEIKAATNQFRNKILGKGGEAKVYFAEIYIDSNKTPVAVKHLKSKRDNSKEFKSEIEILSKVQHPNIVSLIGYCNESGHKILVYEHMEKGSLSDLLKMKSPNALTWLQRLNICLDVARGLQYLHCQTDEYGKGIIHRDMKPGNILVGENFVGKVSDFGLLKLSTAGQDKSTMATAQKGTSGYLAPEYSFFARVTRKTDVFSFGVVLFYVLCEKLPWDREDDESYFFNENDDLGNWAMENIESQIRREISGDSLALFTDIIRRSLQMKPGNRPTMEGVVLELQKVLECQGSEKNKCTKAYLHANPGERPPEDDENSQRSENIGKEFYDSDEENAYWQENPSDGSSNDDQNIQESENLPKQPEGSARRYLQFSLEEIKAATNQFDDSQLLGKGGHGKVYYAEVYIDSIKTPVAVKHLHRNNFNEFELELNTMSKIRHPNIVSLIGYCYESGHKILVYQYMANGPLSRYLRKGTHISFSWLERLNVCLGAARGLQHLHTATDEFPKGIIHRDVKPGSILVGENLVAKLSNLGMFKLSEAGQEISMIETALKGTSGYFAPEYNMLRRVTRKIDVFGFGVVLFQVLCRKLPWDRDDDSYYMDENEDLGIWAKENVDAQIGGEVSGESLTLFTDIIGRSLQVNPGKRPTMDEVVQGLQKAIECQESENLAKQLKAKDAKKSSIRSLSSPLSPSSSQTSDLENEQLRQELSSLKEMMRQMMQREKERDVREQQQQKQYKQ